MKTRMLTILPVPGGTATNSQRMDFLHNQLDRIQAAAHNTYPAAFLGGLFLSGSQPRDRLQGGAQHALLLIVPLCTSEALFCIDFGNLVYIMISIA
jgi:hypothetical protein